MVKKAAKKKTAGKKAASKKTTKAKAKPQTKRAATHRGGEGEILSLIKQHHQPLKDLIEVLKDSEASLSERKSAFEEFAPLLASHAKAEEEVLYVAMKNNEELREDGFEGDVEHIMADQLLEEIPRTTDEDLWSARVKVLAEMIEHHVKEEEQDMFPEIRKELEESERVELGSVYNQRYEELLSKDGVDSPAEKPKAERMIPSVTHS
jgi:hemerythrin superfamily protein